MSDIGYVEQWTKPATGVTQRKEVSLNSALKRGLEEAVQEISAAAAIDLNVNHVKITGPAASTYAVTLAAPSRGGQLLVIEMVGTTSTNAVTLALTNVGGGSAATTATFNAADETLTLISSSNKWWVLTEEGVTLA